LENFKHFSQTLVIDLVLLKLLVEFEISLFLKVTKLYYIKN